MLDSKQICYNKLKIDFFCKYTQQKVKGFSTKGRFYVKWALRSSVFKVSFFFLPYFVILNVWTQISTKNEKHTSRTVFLFKNWTLRENNKQTNIHDKKVHLILLKISEWHRVQKASKVRKIHILEVPKYRC